MQGKYWSFTVFTDDTTYLTTISWGTWGVAQYESCPTTGRLHIQGFVEFSTNMRLNACRKLVPTEIGESHWELKEAKYIDDQVKYCTADDEQKASIKNAVLAKQGQPPTAMPGGGRVFGTFPHWWGTRPTKQQGKRTDLHDAADFALSDTSGSINKRMRRVAEAHPAVFIKYAAGIERLLSLTSARVQPVELQTLRRWQAELYQVLVGKPDDRHIWWFHDPTGGVGKSTFVTWMYDHHPDDVTFLSGENRDMAYLYQGERIVFFDQPRSTEGFSDHLCAFGERLKDGRLVSTKYQASHKRFAPPHVVFFANHPCPKGKFSDDRVWEVTRFDMDEVPVVNGVPVLEQPVANAPETQEYDAETIVPSQ